MPKANDPLQLAGTIRDACVQAALDGYEQAQIAGLCHEGAWECAVDAIRRIDIRELLTTMETAAPRPPREPASS